LKKSINIVLSATISGLKDDAGLLVNGRSLTWFLDRSPAPGFFGGGMYMGGIMVAEPVDRLDDLAGGTLECGDGPSTFGESFGISAEGACHKVCYTGPWALGKNIGAGDTGACEEGLRTGKEGSGVLGKTFGASYGIRAIVTSVRGNFGVRASGESLRTGKDEEFGAFSDSV
jgi:hypothetical protein